MNTVCEARRDLRVLADPARAAILQRFFKTGKGEYGEGDRFLGLTVPQVRKLARAHEALPFEDLDVLLDSRLHEERQLALLILVRRFQKSEAAARERICGFYLERLKAVDNWDLVDLSAPAILGAWLEGQDKSILCTMARSPRLWDRRVAMLATFHDIRAGRPETALAVAEILVNDPHDLIQKAVGWMLREIGKRCSEAAEEAFLARHQASMPRTALRYAIERFEPTKRRRYLK